MDLLLIPIPIHLLNQYHLSTITNIAEYYESKICGGIEKLNQLNYLRLVTRMRHQITATQCLSIVLGEEPEIPAFPNLPEPEIREEAEMRESGGADGADGT